MFEKLKSHFKKMVPFTNSELELIDHFFEERLFKKKEYLLRDTNVCNFIGFIEAGVIRHFHIKDGIEKTCDITFENSWVTDFHSFTVGTTSKINLQALQDTRVYVINKENLYKLYKACNKFETFARLMAEQVAQKAIEMAMSLSSEKPEERFNNLLEKQPNLFQKVPQKYIANLLGISPESLSRIRSRVFHK